jgi:Skp family chaperone for outer membrane proteins
VISGLNKSQPSSFAESHDLSIAVVDMQRIFKEYNKTKDAEAKVNDAKNAAKKEFDDRTAAYTRALDEINRLNGQLEAPGLSVNAKTAKAKERDNKSAEIKTMERELNDFRKAREEQLQQQAMRMREGIVQEITEIVLERVKSNGMDLVFDKSGQSTNYVPVVLYSRDSADFTAEIVTALNKKSASAAADKPEKSTTSTSPAKAATSPAKPPPTKPLEEHAFFESEKHAVLRVFFLVPGQSTTDDACTFELDRKNWRASAVRSGFRNAAFIFSLPLLFASAALAGWEATLSASSPPSFPGPRPMHIKYGLGWSGFPGANADVRLTKPSDERFQLSGTVHTTGLVRTLWKFDGSLMSRVDAGTLHPLETKQIENIRNKKTVTSLSFEAKGVTSKETETPGAGPKIRRFDFPNLFDLYSALLYLKSQPLQDRSIQRIVVYPATSAYLATVTVLGRERLTGPSGTYNAIKLDLQLSKIGKNRELMPHRKFRRANVWLSDDSDRLLLRIQAQIFVGTVFAELQSVEFEETKSGSHQD